MARAPSLCPEHAPSGIEDGLREGSPCKGGGAHVADEDRPVAQDPRPSDSVLMQSCNENDSRLYITPRQRALASEQNLRTEEASSSAAP